MKTSLQNQATSFQNRKKYSSKLKKTLQNLKSILQKPQKIKKATSGYCKKRKNRKKALSKGSVTLNGVIQNYSG